MIDRDGRRPAWRFFDGAVSISASTWLAIGLGQCSTCDGWPLVGFLGRLATNETGIIVVATVLLFPTAALMFGGFRMFFAAKEAAERWSQAKDAKAMAKGREQGLEAGRKEERREIAALLKEHDVPLPPEVLSRLNGDGDSK